ncbi:hypothetical protein GCM10022226_41970 [Sphaerisporangium flaviroseum]|uniref:Alkaline phosphatase family protein n=1 Tax=Sphaerisporangium flaviroseum TaxID=509199 RepID=A0ABP7IFA9_9ACTN
MLSDAALVRECAMAYGGGVRPHSTQSLHSVPGRILDELGRSGRGVVILAVDGLSWRAACERWRSADLVCLTSTFPSTSATAWMTAVTGTTVTEHLVVGAVYRSPAGDALVDVIRGEPLTGQVPAGRCDALSARPTVFEAAASRAHPLALGRELDTLGGSWAAALLRGARRGQMTDPRELAAQAGDPEELVAAVARDVEGALVGHRQDRPLLLWIYVNLDDHVHRHGYDPRAMRAVELLERHALSWAGRGWTVLAHSDHGQVPCAPDPELEAAWARVEVPALCRLPGGGAGRVRWLYPRQGRATEVAERLGTALAGHALVIPADELPGLGLLRLTPAVRERIGGVVAMATSPRFPAPVRGMAFEHGALSPGEMLVPLATWS